MSGKEDSQVAVKTLVLAMLALLLATDQWRLSRGCKVERVRAERAEAELERIRRILDDGSAEPGATADEAASRSGSDGGVNRAVYPADAAAPTPDAALRETAEDAEPTAALFDAETVLRLLGRAELAEAERDRLDAMLDRCDEARERVIAERDRLREAIRAHRDSYHETIGMANIKARNTRRGELDAALWAALTNGEE